MVSVILDNLPAGLSHKEILESYPSETGRYSCGYCLRSLLTGKSKNIG